ncbi:MAG: hypothetical protein ACFCBW_16005 [Candidatus Competibacterales bacterium]
MPNQFQGRTFGSNGMSYLDDMFTGWLGIGTQYVGAVQAIINPVAIR